ncbi:hypothetical protein ABTF55_21415, partial [Acinetobacter baumannii]
MHVVPFVIFSAAMQDDRSPSSTFLGVCWMKRVEQPGTAAWLAILFDSCFSSSICLLFHAES